MTDPHTDTREAPPPVDLRPHVVAYLANNLRTNGYEHHARTMEALASLRAAGEPVAWTNEAGDVEPISDAVKQARPDLYAKGYTRPLFYAAPQASADPTRAMLDGKPLDGEFAKVMADKFDEICIRPAAEDSAKGAGVWRCRPYQNPKGTSPRPW